MTTTDPIIAKLRATLRELYGPRLERLVLFGSRARGEARADSDYDIAVFIHDLADRDLEVNRLADVQLEMWNIANSCITVDVIPLSAGAWLERTTFMHELRREGIDL